MCEFNVTFVYTRTAVTLKLFVIIGDLSALL